MNRLTAYKTEVIQSVIGRPAVNPAYDGIFLRSTEGTVLGHLSRCNRRTDGTAGTENFGVVGQRPRAVCTAGRMAACNSAGRLYYRQHIGIKGFIGNS